MTNLTRKVYIGSQYPLLHDYKSHLHEQLLFGPPIDYVGVREPHSRVPMTKL